VAVRKNLDLVWVWFYKDGAPMARYEQQTMKKVIPILFLVLLQGCLMWSRQWDLGTCRELSPGIYSCIVKVKFPKSFDGVSVGVNIFFETEKHLPVKNLKIRIENEESHTIQIQGISPFVLLKPGESHELTVTVGQDTNGAYVCGFGESARVKFEVSGENLDGTTIKFKALGAYGM
jgi:hypothetical protein